MMELIQKIGFLPLLDSGIEGFSADRLFGGARRLCLSAMCQRPSR